LPEPLKPVSRGARAFLGAAFFVLFFAAWAVATFGGLVDGMFLKDPVYTGSLRNIPSTP
jgi:NitT/TauT family transport system permease protein